MGQYLIAPVEDLSSIPSTHIGSRFSLTIVSPMGSYTLLWPLWAPGICIVIIHT